ncbi:MAG: hypothetical protein ACM3US_14705 [Sphingomonadaceae bacterium]
MSISISRHGLIWLAVVLFLVGLLLLALPPTGQAQPAAVDAEPPAILAAGLWIAWGHRAVRGG